MPFERLRQLFSSFTNPSEKERTIKFFTDNMRTAQQYGFCLEEIPAGYRRVIVPADELVDYLKFCKESLAQLGVPIVEETLQTSEHSLTLAL